MHLEISEADAALVSAILRTHAEMQDMRVPEIMSVMARLKRDEPTAAFETILDLQSQINDFEVDADNLKRIANLFGVEEHASS